MLKSIFESKNQVISPEYLLEEKEFNADYQIIAKAVNGNEEIVLGQHTEMKNRYVTWRCSNITHNIKTYCWGNYFNNRKSAVLDFYKRVKMMKKRG